ncbi:MAG: hypothetical protein ACTSQP_07465 [Promethearchaeota archaeon]
MTFSEFIVKSEDLIVLLNILYDLGSAHLIIKPYILGHELFSIKLDGKVRLNLLISKDDYYDIIQEISGYKTIVPNYQTIRDILIGSGFLELKNYEDLISELNKLKKINPLLGQRLVDIGMDTNCFMNRLFSQLLLKYRDDLKKFIFISSRIVKHELTNMKKIRKEDLQAFIKAISRNKDIFEEFWNSETLESRKKHIGLIDYNKLRKAAVYNANDAVQLRDDVDFDKQIIDDYRNQILNKNHDLLLLSSDRQFHDYCREPGIKSIYLEIPSLENLNQQNYCGNWEQLCDLIYLSSIYFGAISLISGDKKIQIFGIWRGKQTREWDSEQIKLKIGSERISKLISGQFEILGN